MMDMGIGEDVTVFSRTQTGTSSRGNPIYSENLKVYSNVVVAFSSEKEAFELGANPVTTQLTLHFTGEAPTDENLADTTALIRGQKYELEGYGFDWISPYSGEFFGKAVKVRKKVG